MIGPTPATILPRARIGFPCGFGLAATVRRVSVSADRLQHAVPPFWTDVLRASGAVSDVVLES